MMLVDNYTLDKTASLAFKPLRGTLRQTEEKDAICLAAAVAPSFRLLSAQTDTR